MKKITEGGIVSSQENKKVEVENQKVTQAQKQEVNNHSAHTPESVQSIFQKGIQEYNSGNLEEALKYFIKVQVSTPNEPTIAYNVASTYRRLNQMPQAIEAYKKTIELNPNHLDATFGLAQAYLAADRIEEGWQLFNAYRPDIVKSCPTFEQLAGKTVIVRHEWGLGDVMHFIRYTKLLKAAKAKVIVETPKALINLLKLCPYIDEVIQAGTNLPRADYLIPLLYLPTLFHTSKTNIPAQVPYLHADTSLIAQWNKTLSSDTHFKIGICWDIGHHDTNLIGWQRSAPLKHWLPFTSIDGISLYSLQKDARNQLTEIADTLKVHDFGANLDTQHGGFMDTAAIMKNIDLIITVDTSVAHLAGALGIPVWVLLPYSPDYRWTLQGDRTQWYPTMRLFRQTKPGDWDSVMKEICFELKKLLKQDAAPQKNPLVLDDAAIHFDSISSNNLVDQLYNAYGKK